LLVRPLPVPIPPLLPVLKPPSCFEISIEWLISEQQAFDLLAIKGTFEDDIETGAISAAFEAAGLTVPTVVLATSESPIGAVHLVPMPLLFRVRRRLHLALLLLLIRPRHPPWLQLLLPPLLPPMLPHSSAPPCLPPYLPPCLPPSPPPRLSRKARVQRRVRRLLPNRQPEPLPTRLRRRPRLPRRLETHPARVSNLLLLLLLLLCCQA